MPGRRTILCCALLAPMILAVACEDMPAGPGGLEALVAESDAVAAGLSLRELFAAALFRVQREEGTDSAVAVLGRWRAARSDGETAPAARAIEAGTVVRAFGPAVVEQAAAVLRGEMREADLAATRVLADGGEMDGAAVERDLREAEVAVVQAADAAARSPEEALLKLDEAATRLADVRARLVEATGLPTLEALYQRALDRAGEGAALARTTEDGLLAAIDSARAEGGIDGRYEAQEALRRHRAQFAVEILGDEVGGGILADVSGELGRLRPALDSLNRAGLDVSRDRRMVDAATAIVERADAALREGDPARALDLAAHAAGLVDELRRLHAR